MTFVFPSPEWVNAFNAAINASDDYRSASVNWTHGAVALVTRAQPAIGLPDDVTIWLDLQPGSCRDAKLLPGGEADAAPFVLTGEYRRWKQIIRKELGPIAAILQGKLALHGSLPIIVRNVRVAESMVECATRVPTRFLDE